MRHDDVESFSFSLDMSESKVDMFSAGGDTRVFDFLVLGDIRMSG